MVQVGLHPNLASVHAFHELLLINILVLMDLTEHTRPYTMEWLPVSERHADEYRTMAADTPALHY